MAPAANLFDQQESNRRRSFWLVVGFLLFLIPVNTIVTPGG